MSDHKSHGFLKKLFMKKRLKRDLIMQRHFEAMEHDKRRLDELDAQRNMFKRADDPKEEEIWSAKTQDIKNRISGKKRASKDRWNRFAGTEGGGGRGR